MALNIIQITPGAGGMFCGGCFRDNALVAAWRRQGHETLMVPLYLPLTLDEPDQSRGTPIFFSGINVYLEQKIPWFRNAPAWLHRWLAHPALLKLASGRAARTRAEDVGDLTLSMFRGEEGNQARELNELVTFLRREGKPDVICLSNALLLGLARELKKQLRIPVVCLLQGEDTFLDALPPKDREVAWQLLTERAREIDLFIAPTHYYSRLMGERLGIPDERLKVIFNGIAGDDFAAVPPTPSERGQRVPVLGYFARMCREKGVETIVETYIALRERNRIPNLRLHLGGGLGPSDQKLVRSLEKKLHQRGYSPQVQLFPNVDKAGKVEFYRGLSVFCTPAMYGEAFGLYVIEAFAAGVPVVAPRHAAFPELIEASGGGLIAGSHPQELADRIEEILLQPDLARELSRAGRQAAAAIFSVDKMSAALVEAFQTVTQSNFKLSPTP